MKFLSKLLIALLLGLAVYMTQSQTVQACCCVRNDPKTGLCEVCVPCDNDPPGEDPWTCFAAGTHVSLPTASQLGGQAKVDVGPYNEAKIEDIKVGDKVISQDEAGNRSVSTVTELDQPVRDHMCRVDFEANGRPQGSPLRMTTEHPIMTKEGWKSITPSATAKENPELIVGSLSIGDKVVREDGGYGEISNITCWSKKTPAYNLILDSGARTYFADGYLAHNKGGGNTCAAGTELKCGPIAPGQGYVCAGGSNPVSWCDPLFPMQIANISPPLCGPDQYGDYGYRCMTNCSCCPTGQDRVAGGTYVYAFQYMRVPGTQGQRYSCRQQNDEYLNTIRTYNCYWANEEDPAQTCTVENTCRTATCAPVCTAAAPSAAGLVAPANGATLTSTSVLLDWNATASWGTKCPAPNVNQYKIYVGTPNPPTTLNATVASTVTSSIFTATPGVTYNWFIQATNGGGTANSLTRNFCVSANPAIPTLSYPISEASLTSTSVNLLWNTETSWGAKCPSPNVNQYKIYLDACPASPNAIVAPTTLFATVGSGVLSRMFTTGVVGNSYCWRVQATNGGTSTYSVTRRFKILNNQQITGSVFNDVNNNCGGSPLGGGTVRLDAVNYPVAGNGTFSLTALAGSHTLAVSIPAGYTCSTGAGCNSCSRTVVSPSVNNNFYLTDASSRTAWWQTLGAGVYSGATSGTTIGSEIPSSVVAGSRYLVLPGAGGGSAAAVVRAGGQVPALGSGDVSANLWSAVSKYKGKKMDYAFFGAQMGLLTSSPLGDLNTKPVTGQDFYYKLGDSTVGDWSVNSGESYVVFVDGNLRITSNITVANGGFLAFIVKGDVTVDPSVLNVQGLYVMDGNFVTESGASDQLNVEGTVVAWGAVSLGRDLGATNSSTPAEKFAYRPDLISNMPDKMKSFMMQWQEVVAGSFGQ